MRPLFGGAIVSPCSHQNFDSGADLRVKVNEQSRRQESGKSVRVEAPDNEEAAVLNDRFVERCLPFLLNPLPGCRRY
jgi:hypothetical protein